MQSTAPQKILFDHIVQLNGVATLLGALAQTNGAELGATIAPELLEAALTTLAASILDTVSFLEGLDSELEASKA